MAPRLARAGDLFRRRLGFGCGVGGGLGGGHFSPPRRGGTPSGLFIEAHDVAPVWLWLEALPAQLPEGTRTLRRVFDRFYRVDEEAVRARRGTGLGLFVVRALVRGIVPSEEVGVTPLAASSCETAPTVPDEPSASSQRLGAKGYRRLLDED